MLSRFDGLGAGAGVAAAALTILSFILTPWLVVRTLGLASPASVMHHTALVQSWVMTAGVMLTAFSFTPSCTRVFDLLRMRWRDAYTYCALGCSCALLSVFLVHMGRRQFGGWDYSIMIETGWRQILGQRPYVDFATTTPPGFNLGIKYAYELFGASWDANLYFSALFASVSFLWLYWLMVLLQTGRLAAMGMAFAVECAAMLTLCFWWYNNSTLILSAVFFLSCLLYARKSRSLPAQFSYFASLTLLSLMKPNIAGVAMLAGVMLLLVVSDRKGRVALWTLGAAGAAVALLLINHVSIAAMLASYQAVASERGGLNSKFGFRLLTTTGQSAVIVWILVLSIPLLTLVERIPGQWRQKDWRSFLLSVFFFLGPLLAAYGMATNGELLEVECTVLLAAGAVLVFGREGSGPLLRRVYIAIVCAAIVSDLYYGAIRTRVYRIGLHQFFEWRDHDHMIASGFLKNMRVSSTMVDVERQVRLARDANPGPYFFGPRMDFNYAVQGLPSPDHLPLWWEPGTAFGRSDEAHLVQVWQDHKFATLIFLKDDYSFYGQGILDLIRREYVEDDGYPRLTVYRRREPVGP